MHKLIHLKNGGAVIDISPLTDIDIAVIFHGREMLVLENMLDGTFDRQYNPNCKLKAVSRKNKTSSKKQTSKPLKARTVTTK
jgi:hypothetical protein